MNGKERKTLIIYAGIMLGLAILSRLYWIYGDDPIGLILVFFFLAPLISFFFALGLGNARLFWCVPFLAGLANVFNYMCNSTIHFHWRPDSGTLWVFGFCFAAAWAGILFTKVMKLLTDRGR